LAIPNADAVKTPRDLAPFLEHTLLAPGATQADLERVCREAWENRLCAVCVHRSLAPEAKRLLKGSPVKIVAVVDFPKGEAAIGARVIEALEAVRAGVQEIDIVAPLPAIAAGRWEAVLDDLRAVVRSVPVPVKVILETALLARDAKAAAAAVARCAGAAWVKTSTNFGPSGATADDVALLRKVVGEQVGVKASGGIRTAADALAMIRAGADRIGASASVAIVSGRF
jgi:deoxyribose-phosphate aldolase